MRFHAIATNVQHALCRDSSPVVIPCRAWTQCKAPPTGLGREDEEGVFYSLHRYTANLATAGTMEPPLWVCIRPEGC